MKVDGSPSVLTSPPTVEFFQKGEEIWADIERVTTDLDGGRWSVVITVPEDAQVGWAEVRWLAVPTDGDDVNGSESFEIVSSTFTPPLTDLEHSLRRRLRDTLSDVNDDSGAFFPNDEIHTLLAINGNSINAAALDGWLIKMAYYSKYVDVDESGSTRRLSQMFKNAEAMVAFYQKATDTENATAAVHRKQGVIGRVISLRGEYNDVFGLKFLAQNGVGLSHVYSRPFPTKRLITGV